MPRASLRAKLAEREGRLAGVMSRVQGTTASPLGDVSNPSACRRLAVCCCVLAVAAAADDAACAGGRVCAARPRRDALGRNRRRPERYRHAYSASV